MSKQENSEVLLTLTKTNVNQSTVDVFTSGLNIIETLEEMLVEKVLDDNFNPKTDELSDEIVDKWRGLEENVYELVEETELAWAYDPDETDTCEGDDEVEDE